MNPCIMPRRRGFTLIELLVVITIIAILAAILFPVFAQAKSSAKKAVCISNLKQVSLGTIMYGADYDDYMFVQSSRNGNDIHYWFYGFKNWFGGTPVTGDQNLGLLHPYMKSYKIIDCPEAGGVVSAGAAMRQNDFWPAYGINTAYLYNSTGEPVSLTASEDPANTVLLSDTASARITGGVMGPLSRSFGVSPPSRGNISRSFHARHLGKGVVAWLDGHANVRSATYRVRNGHAQDANNALWVKALIGDIARMALPPQIAANDPDIPKYDYFFTLTKVDN